MINYDEIVKNVVANTVKLEIKYIKKIAEAVLGMEIDDWGNVKLVKQELIAELTRDPDVQAAIEDCRKRIVEEIKKPLTQNNIREMTSNIRRRLMDELEENIYHEIYYAIYDKMSLSIKEKLSTDAELAPYYVAGKVGKL
jgi:hypothetical protein